jgi:pimeloyl-ACP methyl ester carboxylesterase
MKKAQGIAAAAVIFGATLAAHVARAQLSGIKRTVAITVFPDEVFRAQERWARSAFRNLIYFHEADRGGHFAMWEHPELFAGELRAAFRSLRGAQ